MRKCKFKFDVVLVLLSLLLNHLYITIYQKTTLKMQIYVNMFNKHVHTYICISTLVAYVYNSFTYGMSALSKKTSIYKYINIYITHLSPWHLHEAHLILPTYPLDFPKTGHVVQRPEATTAI